MKGPFPYGACLLTSQRVGGGTLIFSYIILNFNIFGGFQKNEYFLGYEDFVIIFLGSSQHWTIFRGHFYAF